MLIKNYFLVAIRTFLRHRIFTLISVLGLAIGLGISLISISYVVRESSWEKCHENYDRIYRVEMQYRHADTTWSSARVMAPLGDALAGEIPGIEQVAVFRHSRAVSLDMGPITYKAGALIFARPEFFEVFTFPFRTGDPASSLREPYSILITDSIAGVYFPDRDPIGKTIVINDETEFNIVGVLEDIPGITQLHCDFIASYSTLEAAGANLQSWSEGTEDLTYLLLDEGADPQVIESQVTDVFSGHVPDEISQRYTFSLKPLGDIYFDTYYSGNRGEIWPGGEYDVMILVICAGLFILLQAMINFINLSTARATGRSMEVGVRKTFGAQRSKLVMQFLGESMLLTFVATALGLAFYEFFRSGYHKVTPDVYELPNLYAEPGTFMLIILLTIVVGILAGFYPALYLSRFKPIAVLSAGSTISPSRSLLRKALVVFQFTLAIFFIIETVGHYKQLKYMTGYELGFEKENIMVLQFSEYDTGAADCALAKNEILTRNDVIDATRNEDVMGTSRSYILYYDSPERLEVDRKYAKFYTVDYNFLSFYGIDLIEGRGFSSERPEDINHSLLINESMKNELGLSNPIGHKIFGESITWEIIGVVKDFYGSSLRSKSGAKAFIALNPDACKILSVKLRPDDEGESIMAVRNTWEQLFGDREFDYSFLEDDIRAQYEELDSIVTFFGTMSIISIIVAGMGIFGLVLFTVERRTKETAIRKVLGASVTAIMKILTKEFVYLIIISNLIACPFAYLMISWTIDYYPIKANIGIFTYISGGLLTILIALIISCYHVIKAARANPVDSLRYQ